MQRLLSIVVLFGLSASLAVAQPVTKPIKLFNGKDMTNFYTYLQGIGKNKDEKGVFTVKDGAIRVSGEVFGCFTTEKEYENYRLIVEYKWGTQTWGGRAKKTMDSGVLLHCVGPDGGSSYNKEGKPSGPWMESIECQMIEGGTGDFILVGGKGKPKITAKVTQIGKQWYYDPKGKAKEFTGGRINWFGRDPDWKDVKGFRGKNDVEKPVGEWNKLECICDGDKITNLLNGVVVNKGTNASHTKGKILFQSEGAEVFFRKIELQPLKKAGTKKKAEPKKKEKAEPKKEAKAEPKKDAKVEPKKEAKPTPPVVEYTEPMPVERPRLLGGFRPLQRLLDRIRRR